MFELIPLISMAEIQINNLTASLGEPMVALGLGALLVLILGYLSKYLKQPLFLAYIIAGIIIGPTGLNIIQYSQVHWFAELGVALLLFYVGTETDFSKLSEAGMTIIVGGILHVGLIALVSFAFMQMFTFLTFTETLYLAFIVSFSSTTVVVKILSDKQIINSLQGRLMIGFLLIEDFLIILIIPLLTNLSNQTIGTTFVWIILKALSLFVIAIILNNLVFPWLLRFTAKSRELFYILTLTVCFSFISLASLLNMSIAVGAFIAGLAFSTFPYYMEEVGNIKGLRDFFATIFFVGLGLQLTFNFSSFPIGLFLGLLLILFILKPLIFGLLVLYAGYGGRIATNVAVGLAQVSEFSLILALIGFQATDLSQGVYSMVILITAISMTLTPYMMNFSEPIYSILSKIFSKISPIMTKVTFERKLTKLRHLPPEKKMKNHIVVIGAGVTGQHVIENLHNKKVVVALDHDPEVIFDLVGKGYYADIGDAMDSEALNLVNLKGAKLLIITIPGTKKSIALLKKAKKENKALTVFCNAKNALEEYNFYKSGADYVIRSDIIGANLFVKNIFRFLKTNAVTSISNLNTEYMHYLEEEIKEKKKHINL